MIQFFSKSPAETENFAENFAREISVDLNSPHTLCFRGDLGAGKTTFLRGFAHGLGISEAISSPSFALVHTFECPGNARFSRFAHFDLYRADSPSALAIPEIMEYFDEKNTVCAVEWSEKLPRDFFSEKVFFITLKTLSEREREIEVEIS